MLNFWMDNPTLENSNKKQKQNLSKNEFDISKRRHKKRKSKGLTGFIISVKGQKKEGKF